MYQSLVRELSHIYFSTVKFKEVITQNKPSVAPTEFTVFHVEGERYIFCPIRNRLYKVDNKPEEIVRQYWIYRLKEDYKYDFSQIGVEVKSVLGN